MKHACLGMDYTINPLFLFTQVAFQASLGAFQASLVEHLPLMVVYLKARECVLIIDTVHNFFFDEYRICKNTD